MYLQYYVNMLKYKMKPKIYTFPIYGKHKRREHIYL